MTDLFRQIRNQTVRIRHQSYNRFFRNFSPLSFSRFPPENKSQKSPDTEHKPQYRRKTEKCTAERKICDRKEQICERSERIASKASENKDSKVHIENGKSASEANRFCEHIASKASENTVRKVHTENGKSVSEASRFLNRFQKDIYINDSLQNRSSLQRKELKKRDVLKRRKRTPKRSIEYD